MRPGQGLNKQLNLLSKESLPSNNQMSITSKQSEAVTLHDVHVQTSIQNVCEPQDLNPDAKAKKQADQIELYFKRAQSEHPTAVPNF